MKVHFVELKESRKESIELKQSFHAYKEFCDTNLALKDEEIKQDNKANNSKIGKLMKENTQRLVMKEEEIVESNHETEFLKTLQIVS